MPDLLMTPLQAAIGYAGTATLVTALAGLVARKHYRDWWSFCLYLSFLSSYAVLVGLWPGRYHRPAFWVLNESVANVLRFATALELSYRTFRGFPRAMARLRVLLLALIALTLAVVLAAAPPWFDYAAFMGRVHPRFLNGSVWLFTAVGALTLWYRLPMREFHKRVLLSWVPYLLVFTVAINAVGAYGWEHGLALNYLNQLAYLAMVAYWAYAAWQPVRVPDIEPIGLPAETPG